MRAERPAVAQWLAGAAVVALVCGLALRPMGESDLFFHLKVGQLIRARHALLGRNLFSFTAPDYPDVDTSWLAEVAAAVAYGWHGFAAVTVAKTVLVAAAFGLAFRRAVARGAAPATAAIAVAAAAIAGSDRMVERPLVFSFIGEVGTLWAIDALSARAGRAAWGTGALFLAGIAIWANLHAGVFVAPLLLAAAAVAAAGTGDRPAATRLALTGAGSLVAMMLTPVGAGLFRYLALHLTLPALHAVDEFRHPTWTSDARLWVYAGALVLAIASAAACDPQARRRLALGAAPVVPLMLLAGRTVRFGADFALVSAPVLAEALAVLGRRLAPPAASRIAARHRGTAAAALIAVLVAAGLGARWRRGLSIGLDTSELPLDAIAFASANGLRDRMYNDFEIGSYLIFDPADGYPRHRVFVDPRLPAYPPEMHRLLGRGDLSRAEWDAAMDRYGVTSALLAYAGINRRVAWWDPTRWALVWNTGDARVFVRRLPQFAPLIAAREVPATFSFSPDEGAATVPLDEPPPLSPVAPCEWARRLGDLLVELDGALTARARAAYDRGLGAAAGCLAAAEEARLAAWLGGADLQAGRAAAALQLLERATRAGDRTPETAANRAAALEAVGRAQEARAVWQDVAARAAGSALGDRASQRLNQR